MVGHTFEQSGMVRTGIFDVTSQMAGMTSPAERGTPELLHWVEQAADDSSAWLLALRASWRRAILHRKGRKMGGSNPCSYCSRFTLDQ